MASNAPVPFKILWEGLSGFSTLEDDKPLSAYVAWLIRNNVQHFLDQSCQHLVNWSAATGDDLSGSSSMTVTNSKTTQRFELYFPLASIRPDRPFQLDIRMAVEFSGSATSLDVEASLYPVARQNDVLWSTSVSGWTSGSGTWAIDELATWTTETRQRSGGTALRSVDANGDGESVAYLDMCTLSVELTGSFSGAGTIQVIGFLVREYP